MSIHQRLCKKKNKLKITKYGRCLKLILFLVRFFIETVTRSSVKRSGEVTTKDTAQFPINFSN